MLGTGRELTLSSLARGTDRITLNAVDGDGLRAEASIAVEVIADRDRDGDKIGDSADNCPLAFNPAQSDLDDDGTGDACEAPLVPPQVPGDCNQDGSLDVSDSICVFGFLFLGAPRGLPCGDGTGLDSGNLTLLDFNGDGAIDLSDGVTALGFLFLGGPPHALGTECLRVAGCAGSCRT